MNSWARSACYPRRSFCPISHGPSTRNRRITLPWFPTCSACRPRSQPGLCQCTPRVISIHPEPSFGRLRYLLGGDRPSQTAHQARFPELSGLEPRIRKGGISPLAPSRPRSELRSLPPILRIRTLNPVLRCSKAARGLFVLLRVIRIFTETSISPGPPLRQRSGRYAIHAGRNLPDKGLRYLRTVRVTAAARWGFSSKLSASEKRTSLRK